MYANLNEYDEKIIQPKNICIPLMEHQKTCIYAMKTLEETGKLNAKNIIHYGNPMDFNIDTTVSILADKVGSGKSLMIISLIELNKVLPNKDIYWIGSKFISIKSSSTNLQVPINLLLIPHKIIQQWLEFYKLAPNLKIQTYKDHNDEIKINTYDDIKQYDIIIVTCTKSKSFFIKFNNIKWSRIIVDEADTINLDKNTIFNASFIWLITATPKSLRYSKKLYLSSIFKNIVPWVFDHLIVKNNDEFIDKSIILPIPKRIVINCLTPKEINVLIDFIPIHILSMINAGNTDDAIKALNCNIDTNDNILKVITNNIQEAINNKKIELDCENKKIYKNQKNIIEQQSNIIKINKCIEKLEIRYNSIKEKIYNLNDEFCPICMSEYNKPTITNCCQNIFCFECITIAISKNGLCPYCRKHLYKQNLHIIELEKSKKLTSQVKDKLEILIELLKSNPNGKFLIFANFAQTFTKIENALQNINITYSILKGSTTIITQTINDFKDGKIKIIMLNAKFFGSGMNLQMATHVILYHRFDNDLEEQVIGRAQRLGRTEQLNVIYLIHDNETNGFNTKDKYEDINYNDWLVEN